MVVKFTFDYEQYASVIYDDMIDHFSDDNNVAFLKLDSPDILFDIKGFARSIVIPYELFFIDKLDMSNSLGGILLKYDKSRMISNSWVTSSYFITDILYHDSGEISVWCEHKQISMMALVFDGGTVTRINQSGTETIKSTDHFYKIFIDILNFLKSQHEKQKSRI